ncbi:uncharacterized protein MYCFIDRAFT_195071 [Pseudocercospora fijiensis CIRAD86]|uniref:N-acetyltransferase domain-containing protein n=1 Tax=Pseudocercospora fijiensis (strain CIRAD86) TaxID=383855 RepID=M2ZY31_PSEFD|nr:uncharacterized protein MYCFIDRAFT_195071 [Pseudocercospora fijiensis CIRAD86]EME83859.1 hypothetical protein MYCFIDRAFT_195071 [Pseudocercospora fijiensis CIRAD86]
MASFLIRPATLEQKDDELLVDFMDSQIAWLSEIGSAEQWGTESVRESRPDVGKRAQEWIERSERENQWGLEWCRAFVAGAETALGNAESTHSIPVSALVLEGKSPEYVRSILPEQDEKDPFVYLAYLMSNRKAGVLGKGAGSALIAFAKDRVREAGVLRICLDCFAGNDRKLVKYYESQGFHLIKEFAAGDKNWPCAVLEMRL